MSKDEILDIVDANDNVIGADTRENVHEKYEIHRGVHVFITGDTGKLLLQKHSKQKSDRPGFWDASIGAQVLSGETYEDAARREAYEELKIRDLGLQYIAKYKSFSDRQREIRVLYSAVHNGPFRPDPAEVAEVDFFTIDEIQRMIDDEKVKFTTGFTISLNHFIDSLGESHRV